MFNNSFFVAFLLLVSSFSVYSEMKTVNDVDLLSKVDTVLRINSSTGNIRATIELTADEICGLLGVCDFEVPGIDYFTGPNGCTMCNVPQGGALELFWGVTNVQVCNALGGTPAWNGTSIEPLSGGSGEFSMLIPNIQYQFPGEVITFILSCSIQTKTTYSFIGASSRYSYLSNQSFSFEIDDDGLTYAFSMNGAKLDINPVSDLSGKSGFESFEKETLPDGVETWLSIAEFEYNSDVEYVAVKKGRCDNLSRTPFVNVSTKPFYRFKDGGACILEPGKVYWANIMFLQQP